VISFKKHSIERRIQTKLPFRPTTSFRSQRELRMRLLNCVQIILIMKNNNNNMAQNRFIFLRNYCLPSACFICKICAIF